METTLRLTGLIIMLLTTIGWGKFISLVLETIFESVKEKIKGR